MLSAFNSKWISNFHRRILQIYILFFQRSVLLRSTNKTIHLPILMFWVFFTPHTIPRAEDLSRSRGKWTPELSLVTAAVLEYTQSMLSTPELLFALVVAMLGALLR